MPPFGSGALSRTNAFHHGLTLPPHSNYPRTLDSRGLAQLALFQLLMVGVIPPRNSSAETKTPQPTYLLVISACLARLQRYSMSVCARHTHACRGERKKKKKIPKQNTDIWGTYTVRNIYIYIKKIITYWRKTLPDISGGRQVTKYEHNGRNSMAFSH